MVLDNAYAISADEVRRPPLRSPCRKPAPAAHALLAGRGASSVCDRREIAVRSLQVLEHYGTDPRQGLSAVQVAEARRRFGRNELAPEPGTRMRACPATHVTTHCSGSAFKGVSWQPWLRQPPLWRWQPNRHAAGCQPRGRACPAHPAHAGTPFWRLVLKQFDDLLVKVLRSLTLCLPHGCSPAAVLHVCARCCGCTPPLAAATLSPARHSSPTKPRVPPDPDCGGGGGPCDRPCQRGDGAGRVCGAVCDRAHPRRQRCAPPPSFPPPAALWPRRLTPRPVIPPPLLCAPSNPCSACVPPAVQPRWAW